MKLQFRPKLWLGILCLIAVTVFSSLGFWQLNRAHQKQAIQQQLSQQKSTAPLRQLPAPYDQKSHLYRPVELEGVFLQNSSFLLDNIVRNRTPGYYVYTPFRMRDGAEILVNRGWVAAEKRRDQLPEIMTPNATTTLKGQLMLPRSKPVMLNESLTPDANHPRRWFFLDLEYANQKFGLALFPLVLHLDPESPHGFDRDWPKPDSKYAMHIGYSIQWFVFALFVLIAFIGVSIRKNKNNE